MKVTSVLVAGATIPAFFVGWLAADSFNIAPYLGTADNLLALKIVIAISIAVTSIPVISKIFNDLGIMQTRDLRKSSLPVQAFMISCYGLH